MAYETLGSSTTRKVEIESSYVIARGFEIASGQTIYNNMMVKLNSSGQVTPVTAVTDQALGRVVSSWEGNDDNNVRVATPFESIISCYSDAGIDEGQELACSGWDATSGLPKFKVATTGDWVSGRCLVAATDTNTGTVGILASGGYEKPA